MTINIIIITGLHRKLAQVRRHGPEQAEVPVPEVHRPVARATRQPQPFLQVQQLRRTDEHSGRLQEPCRE